MSTTVHVKGISHETTEKEVKDFFSFCGKITSISVTPESGAADATKSATVTFEKETAAKTALLLDNTQLGKSQVHVTTANTLDDVASQAGAAVSSSTGEDHEFAQEDKPRSRIVAEYLAHGYTISDNVISKAIALDSKHGFSTKFTNALTNFDSKYKATDKAKSVDTKYGVSDKAIGAWGGLTSYFEKALGTPTGQKVRDFYVQGEKQVTDVHSEARRLADLKTGKPTQSEAAPSTENTGSFQPEPVKGTDKTVCKCGGSEGSCPCPAGHCACANCAKSTSGATTEAKEAAQASGQQLPTGSV